MKPNKKEVGKRIRAIRLRLNITFTEFGEKLGVPKSTVNSWIRGLALPPKEKLTQLALMGGTSINWILWGDEITVPMIQTAVIICPCCNTQQHDHIYTLAGSKKDGFIKHICDDCKNEITIEFEFRPYIKTTFQKTEHDN